MEHPGRSSGEVDRKFPFTPFDKDGEGNTVLLSHSMATRKPHATAPAPSCAACNLLDSLWINLYKIHLVFRPAGSARTLHCRGLKADSGGAVELRLEGIVVIVGNYGSGKSEVAVNLAVHHRQAGMQVRIADLDLVNPYFRSREAADQLTELGIDVVLPPQPYVQSELPVLSPAVAGLIRRPGDLAILDVGGDNVGAMVLAALGDAFAGRKRQVLQVVNPLRPATATPAGCHKIRREIEASAKMAVTGLAGNANLIEETTPPEIVDGYAFMKTVAAESGLPLAFITVAEELLPQVDAAQFDCPVLRIRRQLVPPWKKATTL